MFLGLTVVTTIIINNIQKSVVPEVSTFIGMLKFCYEK